MKDTLSTSRINHNKKCVSLKGASFKILHCINENLISSSQTAIAISITEIQKQTGHSRDTICRVIAQLENDGYISVRRKKLRSDQNETNVYRIFPDKNPFSQKPKPVPVSLVKSGGVVRSFDGKLLNVNNILKKKKNIKKEKAPPPKAHAQASAFAHFYFKTLQKYAKIEEPTEEQFLKATRVFQKMFEEYKTSEKFDAVMDFVKVQAERGNNFYINNMLEPRYFQRNFKRNYAFAISPPRTFAKKFQTAPNPKENLIQKNKQLAESFKQKFSRDGIIFSTNCVHFEFGNRQGVTLSFAEHGFADQFDKYKKHLEYLKQRR